MNTAIRAITAGPSVAKPDPMHELLSNYDGGELSSTAEFCELRLSDCELRWSESGFEPELGHCVTQVHGQWDDAMQMVKWGVPVKAIFHRLAEAESFYQERRAELVRRGLTRSDLDW